jgi:hypothetical protein
MLAHPSAYAYSQLVEVYQLTNLSQQFRQQSNFTPNQQDLAQARNFFDGAGVPGPSSSSMLARPIPSFSPPVLEPAQPTEKWAMQPQAISRVEGGWASEFVGPSQAGPMQPQHQPPVQSSSMFSPMPKRIY